MNNEQERPEDRTIFCKMCKEDRVHMDLEFRGNCRWKCKRCGEYNQPEFDSMAEEILEPVEAAYAKLAKLAWASDTSAALNPEYTKRHLQKIAQEMNGALTLVRHSVEGLLEAQFPPDEFHDGGPDYDPTANIGATGLAGLAVLASTAPSGRSLGANNIHYDDGKHHGGL